MKLDEWVKFATRDIEDFAMMWRAERDLDPDNFPDEMPVGEWFEQFIAHIGD